MKHVACGLLAWAVLAVVFADRLGPIDTLLLAAVLALVPLAVFMLTPQPGDSVVPLIVALPAIALVLRGGQDTANPVGVAAATAYVVATVVPAVAPTFAWLNGTVDRFALDVLLDTAARAFLVVASSWLLLACLRGPRMGFGEPIVLLTSVHFHVAGLGLSALARHRYQHAPLGTTEHRLANIGGWLTLAGIPAVAIGHLTLGVFELLGALTMTSAAWTVAAATSLAAGRTSRPLNWLLITSALAPIAPMFLAVHYGLSRVDIVTQLPYNTIAIIHGTLNLFAFLGLGLVTARMQST